VVPMAIPMVAGPGTMATARGLTPGLIPVPMLHL
jgi:small neutral amino acid transporter SnatA (MarC family)